MGWRRTGTADGLGRRLVEWRCSDCNRVTWTVGSDEPPPCQPCAKRERYLGATHGARHFWASLAQVGAAAEATRLAESYVRAGALAAACTGRAEASDWAVAVADDIAAGSHTPDWRAR